ncbi:MAG: type II secretion system F family protein [Actinomycetota bacterium]|nr:type II secretion system F family protein [Actinomycetota bacterium]
MRQFSIYLKIIQGKYSNLFKLYQVRILEGYTRSEAFTVVGKLSFCDEFKTFLRVIEHSENIGNPVADALKNLSNSFRNNQRDKLKIKAEKIESNLMLVIFIFYSCLWL